MTMTKTGWAILACALALGAPARADVKAGVDAWTQGDYDRAIGEWRPLAIAGDADAQFNMGQAYKLGRGVTVDYPTALDWFKRAADQGHQRAGDNYGLLLFQQGKRQLAMPIIRASAERGEPRAQYLYATALFNGDLVQQDWPRAYAFMTRSARAGVTQAAESQKLMEQYIPAAQRQQGLALVDGGSAIDTPAAQTASTTLPATPPMASAPRAEPAAPRPAPQPKIAKSAPPPRPTPVKAPVAQASATTPPAVPGGRWRIQLGAFSEGARARGLWQGAAGRVSALAGLQPYYVASGGVTRLQAGPLASQIDAAKLCARVKAAGMDCMVKPG